METEQIYAKSKGDHTRIVSNLSNKGYFRLSIHSAYAIGKINIDLKSLMWYEKSLFCYYFKFDLN